nr:DUF2767 family protein [Pantoea vagans]
MQVTEQQYGELEKVYTMIGAVVMAMASDGLETTRLRIAGFIREELARTEEWSSEMKTLMQSAIDTLETYPDQDVIVNLTVIPLLCARAGMPVEDSLGPITRHRGRASAVTALAGVPQGMSLHELMQWAGHSSPQSTMHYIRIRPTQLAASFVKADRVAHMKSVLIDHEPEAASLTGPATYYDLGDSYCMNPF